MLKKKCKGVSVAGIALGLSSLVSLLSPFISNIHALSDYGITITNEAHIGGDSPNGNCEIADMTTRWTNFMSTDTGNRWSYKNTWNYAYNYNNSRQKLDEFHQHYIDNLAAASGWAVTMLDGSVAGVGTGNKMIRVVLFDSNQNVNVVQSGLQFTPSAKVASFMLNPNAGCRFQSWEENDSYWNTGNGANNSILLVKSDHIIYPSDYSGEVLPSTPPPARSYVALGDSFSSGEGNPPFESGTENDCHRSSSAYPRLLESSHYLNLTNFVACSGAKTSDIDGEGIGDQAEALSQNTDVVTLTVGGNDANFKEFATACTISLCDFSTQAYQNAHDKILNELPDKLVDTYQAIDDATSNDVKVYVVGYPYILPEDMPTGANSACFPFNGSLNNSDPTQNNGAAAYAIQMQLNDIIQQAVSNYDSPKFQYVNPNGNTSPFIGHDWCRQDRYFVQIALNQTSYSYHPNALGHTAYSTVVRPQIGY